MTDLTDTRKDGNIEIDFHGQKRSNATHVSTADPELIPADERMYR